VATPVELDRSPQTGSAITRYRLFQSVRLFAGAELTRKDLLDQARGRVTDHVLAASANELDAVRNWDLAAFGRLLALYDNTAAGLRWCLAHDSDGTRSLKACAVLWGVVHQAHTDEIAALTDAVVRRWPDPAAPYAVDAIATAATARFLTGDPAGAFAIADAVLAQANDSPAARVVLRRVMAYAAVAADDLATALTLYAEQADLARRSDLPAMALEADVNRALLLWTAGDAPAARSVARAARDESADRELLVNRVWADTVLAQLDLAQDRESGLSATLRAVDSARRIGYPAAEAVGRRALAWELIRTGDLPAAAGADGAVRCGRRPRRQRVRARRIARRRRPAARRGPSGPGHVGRDGAGAAGHRARRPRARCGHRPATDRRCSGEPTRGGAAGPGGSGTSRRTFGRPSARTAARRRHRPTRRPPR
jgi:hypothetical protein